MVDGKEWKENVNALKRILQMWDRFWTRKAQAFYLKMSGPTPSRANGCIDLMVIVKSRTVTGEPINIRVFGHTHYSSGTTTGEPASSD